MATLPSPPEDLTPEQLYLGHLKLIDQVAAHAAWRCHFSREETEDFVSTVHVKLLEGEYRIIREFKGKSTFRTYLTVVVNHQMLDYLNHLKGKWRSSEEAKRLGPVAVRLEMLRVRERRTFDEACQVLWNEGVEETREQLDEIDRRLPHRLPRPTLLGEEELQNQVDEKKSPEEQALARETLKRRRTILDLVHKVMAALPPEDQLIVKMRCEKQVSQIARALHLEQKPLYRRIDKIHQTLRDLLEKEGIGGDDILDILSAPE